MLTQDQIDEAVRASVPNIMAGLQREIEERLVREAIQIASVNVNTTVTKWVQDNLVPEVLRTLTESKEGLVAAGPLMAKSLVDQLAVTFAETIGKRMEQSWERRKIFEALIG